MGTSYEDLATNEGDSTNCHTSYLSQFDRRKLTMTYPVVYRRAAADRVRGYQTRAPVRVIPSIRKANDNPLFRRNTPPRIPSFGRKGVASQVRAAAEGNWSRGSLTAAGMRNLVRWMPMVRGAELAVQLAELSAPVTYDWPQPQGGWQLMGSWPRSLYDPAYSGPVSVSGQWWPDSIAGQAIATIDEAVNMPAIPDYLLDIGFWYRRQTTVVRWANAQWWRRAEEGPTTWAVGKPGVRVDIAPSILPSLNPGAAPVVRPLTFPVPLPWSVQPYRLNTWPQGRQAGPRAVGRRSMRAIQSRLRGPVANVRHSAVPRPPEKGTKEKKTFVAAIPGGWTGLRTAMNALTEGVDLIDAFYYGGFSKEFRKARDRELYLRLKREGKKFRPFTPAEKAEIVWKYWHRLDEKGAIGAVLTNHLQDQLFGAIGRTAGGAAKRAGRPHGWALGPAI